MPDTDPLNIGLIEHRLHKLEQIVEKLAENQELLTKIEYQITELASSIKRIQERADYQGKTMDEWSKDITELKTKVSSHDWLIRTIGIAVIGALVAAFFALL